MVRDKEGVELRDSHLPQPLVSVSVDPLGVMGMRKGDALLCPDCPETFPPRGPESWRGVRQRLVKHRRKAHGYRSAKGDVRNAG